MRVVVVGGGIIGLAAARLLLREHPGAEVVVVEKETDVGLHQTGHNSGVVHAGLYYEPDSLKARLCRRGATLLRDFCIERDLAFDRCGKVVVATTESDVHRLLKLQDRALANRVPDLRWLDERELREVEPHVSGVAALHSPRTAIVDFAAVARAMAAEIVDAGGTIRLGVAVTSVRGGRRGVVLELDDRARLEADHALVCAGLQSDRLACVAGEAAAPRIVPFRGEYWQLRPERTFLVRGMVYPTPDPALPFLGVHLTRRVDGSVWIGPNAVLGLAREGYARRDIDRRDLWDTMSWPGTRRLVREHWRTGARELARSASKRLFVRDARRYVPALRLADVVPAPAGIRAQAVDRDGRLVDDFRVAQSRNVIWVRNAPSPAATSSMAIAEELIARLWTDRRPAASWGTLT